MNDHLKSLLPNPFAVDYEHPHKPLDLYTELEMFKFAQHVAKDCVQLLAKVALENADNDDQVWIASKTINQITQRYNLK